MTSLSWNEGVRLVLLGTMAGPVFDPARFMTSQLVCVNGRCIMIDCGLGALARMAELRIPLTCVDAIVFTHHHSDHTADYPAFVNMSWIGGPKQAIAIRGPAPLCDMHRHAIAFFDEDERLRIAATGRKPAAASFDVAEITAEGHVMTIGGVTITCCKVDHPPFPMALAYRIDAPGRSIVISGDTTPVEALAHLAKGADVLVHEAMYRPGIKAMLAKRPYVPPFLHDFLIGGHSDASEAGRIAAEAGVGTLVLSHLLPGDMNIPDEVWIAEARRHFSGNIIVGRDKLVL